MKAVRFSVEKKTNISVEYEREKLATELRDKFIPRLLKYFSKKLEKGEIEDSSVSLKYITLIFEKALGSEFSIKELRKIESYFKKFEFLPYKAISSSGRGHSMMNDDYIHDIAFHLIALCRGYKHIVGQHIRPIMVLESKHESRNNQYVGYDKANAIAEDVAELTKKCVREFLQEIQTTGRIMTSTELEEAKKIEIELNTEDSFSSSDHEHDKVNRDSDSTAATEGSNNSVESQQRGTSLHDISEENKNKNLNNVIKANHQLDINSENYLFLQHLFSWIYELPEWLKEQMLNSAPVKAIFEEAKKTTAIYDKKLVEKVLLELFVIEEIADFDDITQNNQDQKITITDSSSEDLVDITVTFDNPQVKGIILPVSISAGDIFDQNSFNGLTIFNALNGIDVL